MLLPAAVPIVPLDIIPLSSCYCLVSNKMISTRRPSPHIGGSVYLLYIGTPYTPYGPPASGSTRWSRVLCLFPVVGPIHGPTSAPCLYLNCPREALLHLKLRFDFTFSSKCAPSSPDPSLSLLIIYTNSQKLSPLWGISTSGGTHSLTGLSHQPCWNSWVSCYFSGS